MFSIYVYSKCIYIYSIKHVFKSQRISSRNIASSRRWITTLTRDYYMFLSWRIAMCLPLGHCMVMELQHQQHQHQQHQHQLSVGLQPYQETMTRVAQEISAGLEMLAPLSRGIAILGFIALLACLVLMRSWFLILGNGGSKYVFLIKKDK